MDIAKMKAVLFDLDGTLHDRVLGIIAFASDQYTRLGIDLKQLNRYVARFQELDSNGRVWKDEVYYQLKNEFELKKNPSVDALVADYVELYPSFAVEVVDAKYTLQKLIEQQITVGIVTNGRSDIQRSVILSLGFNELVKTIVVSEEVGFRKPQREIFDIALKKIGTKAAETFFVGDDPISDVQGAILAGLRPIAFNCRNFNDCDISASTMKGVLHAIRHYS